MSIAVLLVVRHRVVMDALRRLLEDAADIRVVGDTSETSTIVDQVALARPHVVLMDSEMPGCDCPDLLLRMRQAHPGVSIVLLSVFDEEDVWSRTLRAGADGYVPKSASATEVVEAIRLAAHGQAYVHPSVGRYLLQTFLRDGGRVDSHDKHGGLTGRERQVLVLVANGMTTHEIAGRLYLSPNTVHRHRTNLMRKLALHDRLELYRYCLRHGLVDAQLGA